MWTTTEVVSTESTLGAGGPSLVIDSTDTIHIAWNDYTDYLGCGTDYDIFYKRWNATTSTWTTTEVVTTENAGHSYDPSLVADAEGNLHIAWRDMTDYAGCGIDDDIFYKRWDASSSLWTTTEVVSTESTGVSQNPSLDVDSVGNVHIAWNDFTDFAGCGTDQDTFYKCLNITSSTWSMTEVVSTVSTENSFGVSLKADSAGIAHLSWSDEMNYLGSGIDTDIFYRRLVESPAFPELVTNLHPFGGFILISSLLIVLFVSVLKASRIRRRKH